MAKEQFGRSKASAAKTLYAVMQEMKRVGGSLTAKELYPFVESNVPLTDWEQERVGQRQYIRWTNSFQFYSIGYVKAGFIIKKNGTWYLTPEGESVLKLSKEEVMNRSEQAYQEWSLSRLPQDNAESQNPSSKQMPNTVDIELLESNARDGIKDYLSAKSPYEFQDIVAALLRAMGYYTPFIAPKGKDGGVDIIAYVDPLGAQTPRIKVQVKHRPDAVIGASDVRSLVGTTRNGDIALFVTSGSYSPEAKNTARTSDKFIRLIDGDEFIEMWQMYYDKMSDEDKNMLPLRRIAFLGSNE